MFCATQKALHYVRSKPPFTERNNKLELSFLQCIINVISSCLCPSVCVEWWVWAPGGHACMDGWMALALERPDCSESSGLSCSFGGFRTALGGWRGKSAHLLWSKGDEGNMRKFANNNATQGGTFLSIRVKCLLLKITHGQFFPGSFRFRGFALCRIHFSADNVCFYGHSLPVPL